VLKLLRGWDGDADVVNRQGQRQTKQCDEVGDVHFVGGERDLMDVGSWLRKLEWFAKNRQGPRQVRREQPRVLSNFFDSQPALFRLHHIRTIKDLILAPAKNVPIKWRRALISLRLV